MLLASTVRHSSGVVASALLFDRMPALLTSTSTGPISFMADETARASPRSHRTSDPLRSMPITFRPSSLRNSTAARPMVPAAPVTTAILPLRSILKRGLLAEESPRPEGYQRDQQQVHRHERPFGGVGAGDRDHEADQDAGDDRA